MKAILIDPAQRSIETIDVIGDNSPAALIQLHELVGDSLDFAYFTNGESIAVGDHSALHNPPLPAYGIQNFGYPLYGRGVVLGHDGAGGPRQTRLSVDDVWNLVTWL